MKAEASTPERSLRLVVGAAAASAALALIFVPHGVAPALQDEGGGLWALDALRDLPLAVRLALAAAVVAVSVPGVSARASQCMDTVASRLAALPFPVPGAAAALLFWLLRQRNFALGDSALLIPYLTLDVHTKGHHVTLDEPLELLLHSWVYRALHALSDASVASAYALCSIAAGVAFLWLLPRLRARIAPDGPASLMLLVCATGAVQLYFGYVENYTIVATLMLAYAWLALRVLAGEASLPAAAFCLGAAMSFHLMAGWLLPSLLWLAVRTQQPRALASVCALAAPLAATGLLLAATGTPASAIGETHLASLKFIFLIPESSPYYRYGFLSAEHLAGVANQWLLVALPGALALAAALCVAPARQALRRDPPLHFLLGCALLLQLFALTWNPQIGARKDWDLFASMGFFYALAGARATQRLPASSAAYAATAFAVLGTAFSAPWIWSNAQRSIAVDALHGPAHASRGADAMRRGDLDAAAPEFAQALALAPEHPEVRLMVARYYLETRQPGEAQEHFEAYLALEPEGRDAERVRATLEQLR